MTRAERMKQKMKLDASVPPVGDLPELSPDLSMEGATNDAGNTADGGARKEPERAEPGAAENVKDEHKLASFYLSAAELKRYKAYCRATGTTLSRMVGDAVRQYVDAGTENMTPDQLRAYKILLSTS